MAGRATWGRAMAPLADVIEPNGLDHAGGYMKEALYLVRCKGGMDGIYLARGQWGWTVQTN